MKECPQTNNQSVWQHGESVKSYLNDLLKHLIYKEKLQYNWKLPEWIYDPIFIRNIVCNLIDQYALYHDCGKPYCVEYTEGRRHFPNHAEVSYNVYKSVFEDGDCAELIRRDMDFHLLKSVDLQKFSEYKFANILILSALAEIHSNAQMFAKDFDGNPLESIGFKIKWKHTNKRGRQVVEIIKNKNK